MSIKIGLRSLVLLLVVFSLSAFTAKATQNTSAFRSTAIIRVPYIEVPTVVDVRINDNIYGRRNIAIQDIDSKQFQPALLRHVNTEQKTPIRAVSSLLSKGTKQGNDYSLTDNDNRTFVEYSITDDEVGIVDITLFAESPVTSSSFNVQLGQYVALPSKVSVSVRSGSGYKTVLASTSMDSQRVTFPQNTASEWKIKFYYSQPLRIEELELHQKNVITSTTNYVRFLAYPGSSYQLFLNPDREVFIPTPESGNLRSDEDVMVLNPVTPYDNPKYTQADTDNDGVPDLTDNCVKVANSEQEDVNNNGRGDVCDDFDRDGVLNYKDNCPNHPNSRQLDEDMDGIGDVCDGIESRILERYSWLPWAGIMFVAVVVGVLIAKTLKED